MEFYLFFVCKSARGVIFAIKKIRETEEEVYYSYIRISLDHEYSN